MDQLETGHSHDASHVANQNQTNVITSLFKLSICLAYFFSSLLFIRFIFLSSSCVPLQFFINFK